GQAREKWNQMIVAQSGDPDAIERKLNQDHTAAVVVEIKSPRSAYISRCNARVLGEVIRDLGGGRLNKESRINYDVGLDRLAKPGDQLRAGDVLARVHASEKSEAHAAADRVVAAFEFSDARPAACPIAIDTILPEVSRSATTPF